MAISSVIDSPKKMSRYRYFIVIVMMITVGVTYVDRANISILIANSEFLTSMGIESSGVQKGLIMSLFLFAYAFANFLISPLADVFGARKTICAAILLCIGSMFLGGVASVFTLILLSRVLVGLGEGTQYPIVAGVVRNWFPKKERGRANAVWGIGTTIAPALSMPFFAWLIDDYGWHSAFWACLILNVIAMYLVWTYLRDTPQQSKYVNELELTYIEEDQEKQTSIDKKSQTQEKETLFQRLSHFMLDYRYWILVAWYIGIMMNVWGLMTWLPSYLKEGRGFSWTTMGWLASLPFILGIGVKIFAGWAIDVTQRSGIFCMLAAIGAGLGIYLSAIIENNWASALLICMAQGCMYMGAPASWTLLQGIVPEKSMSAASGIMIGIATVAGALSPTILGYFISITNGYSGALYFLVAAALFSSVIMIPLAKR
ncbi:MFS transporter [Vibrio mangrovi]|uniref:MFS transporter n=1 Tax=Vibrio mangrovi TaxID=474394 RepID=A0A1Y6ITV1_9VIBR|nr:MFS transporter [Vibrio mangrovi]MDW6003299.1 MFS transporter [Vibrio mangrovi]SMR99912.1 putative galactarate transporter [Vibrio mangrovi]